MIVDGKVRKLESAKGTEKKISVFEKFKDRVEIRVKNMLPGREILLASVFGYWGFIGLDGMKAALEQSDPIYGALFVELCDKIYSGCVTKQDSINAARAKLEEVTGSSDPEVWAKIFNNGFIDGKNTDNSFRLRVIFYATIPYADQ